MCVIEITMKQIHIDQGQYCNKHLPEISITHQTLVHSWWLEVNCPATSSFYLEEAAFSLSAHAKGVDHLNWA